MRASMAEKPNLKELRNNKGWTQEQTAEHAKISRSHYIMIEHCQRRPSVDVAIKLGECLGFNWHELFAVDEAGSQAEK